MLLVVKLNGPAVFRGVGRKSLQNNALKICCKIVSKTCVQMLFFDQSLTKEKYLQNSYIEMQLLACVVVHR